MLLLFAQLTVEVPGTPNAFLALKEMTGAFVVKFARRPAGEGINRLREFVRNQPGKRVSEISAALDIPSKTVERWVKKLREQGVIVFRGPRKTGGYHVT